MSAKAAANPVARRISATSSGDSAVSSPRRTFEWVDLGRTLLLHVDYWILIAVAYGSRGG